MPPINGVSDRGGSVGNESIGFRCYGIQTTPLEWNGMDNRVIQWIAIRWTQVDGHDPELANWRP